jgi:hypothetical protein
MTDAHDPLDEPPIRVPITVAQENPGPPADAIVAMAGVAKLTYNDGREEFVPSVMFGFAYRQPDGDLLIEKTVGIKVEALHGFDTIYLNAAGEAIRLAELANEAGIGAIASEVVDRPGANLFGHGEDGPSEFISGEAKVAELIGLGRREADCAGSCGRRLFGDVAERGVCFACVPAVTGETEPKS